MKWVPLAEFQQLTNLSDHAFLWLLKHSKLSCKVDPAGIILVDPASASDKRLIEAMLSPQHKLLEEEESILVERLGNIIQEKLGSVIDDTICAYLQKHPPGDKRS